MGPGCDKRILTFLNYDRLFLMFPSLVCFHIYLISRRSFDGGYLRRIFYIYHKCFTVCEEGVFKVSFGFLDIIFEYIALSIPFGKGSNKCRVKFLLFRFVNSYASYGQILTIVIVNLDVELVEPLFHVCRNLVPNRRQWFFR